MSSTVTDKRLWKKVARKGRFSKLPHKLVRNLSVTYVSDKRKTINTVLMIQTLFKISMDLHVKHTETTLNNVLWNFPNFSWLFLHFGGHGSQSSSEGSYIWCC